MSRVRMSVTIRGKEKTWDFVFYGDPKYIKDWEEDGLSVWITVNVIPAWVARLGLIRIWCFVQDVFNFKNPFGGDR